MTTFEVVESKNWTSVATLAKGRIKYKGQSLIPIEMQSILDGGLNGNQAIGGAIAGAVLLGGVGAIAGGALGAARGKVTCLVKVVGGRRLLCRTSRRDFPIFHSQLLEAIEAAPRQFEIVSAQITRLEQEAQLGFTPAQFILGPFYLLRFGLMRFLLAAILTAVTFGLAWFLTPLWSRALVRDRSYYERQRLAADLVALESLNVGAQA